MQITHVSADWRDTWNRFTAQQPSLGMLQSWEWGEFKERMGWKAVRIAVESGGEIVAAAQLLIKPLPGGLGSIAYIPRGPLGDWLNKPAASLLFAELHRTARQNRALFLKVEPALLYNPETSRALQQYGFRPSVYTNQPQSTIILDLQPGPDEILRQMRERTRSYIRSSARKGVTVRRGGSDDIVKLHELMVITGKRSKFPERTLEYYQQEWHALGATGRSILLLAHHEGRLLAAHMASRFGEHAAYIHGGSLDDTEKLYPNYQLMWEAILWAKDNGCRTFDLWGIPPEVGEAAYRGVEAPAGQSSDGLWGVYQFKRGFCKNIVYYMGAYDYVYHALPYALISNKILNMDTFDRISALLDRL